MSEDTTVTGEIRIEPPIPWGELHEERWALAGRDAVVKVDSEETVVPDGVLTKHSGVAIVPERTDQNAYQLVEHVQAIVDRFATAPDGTTRTFTGYLHCRWKGGNEDWRVVVVDGRPVELKPVVVWPATGRLPMVLGPAEDSSRMLTVEHTHRDSFRFRAGDVVLWETPDRVLELGLRLVAEIAATRPDLLEGRQS